MVLCVIVGSLEGGMVVLVGGRGWAGVCSEGEWGGGGDIAVKERRPPWATVSGSGWGVREGVGATAAARAVL